MTVKKSKPLAVDRRDLHSLLDLIGGYGAVIAGIIAILSVCAAFLIYRSFRGQRGKTDEKNGNRTTAVTEEESSTRRRRRERDETESTGEYLEGKQKKSSRESESSDGTVLSAMDDNTLVSSESPEKDLNETTLKDLEDITDEVLTDLEPESGEKSDSDLDQCVEMDPDEPDSNIECEDHIQREDKDGGCKEDICEVLADVSMHTTRLDGQQARDNVEAETEEYLSECEKSETGQSVDADEPSETESAQENIYQKCLDVPAHKTQEDSLNHTFSTQDNSTSDQDVDPDSQSQSEAENKLSTLENLETNKKFEYHHDCFFQQTNDFDICCDDKQTDLPRVDIKTEKDNPIMMGQSCFQGLSYPKDSMSPAVEMLVNHQQHNNRFKYHAEPLNQNYLGFHTEKAFISGSSSQMSLSHGSVDRKADEGASALEKRNKMNEISIMDAIMDNNEWLNVGGPELRDLPWLKPAPNSNNSASEEKLTQKDKEGLETTVPLGQVEASLATQEEELANKKVATVPPMPLPVNVTFRIHYITYCPSQLVAVTGSLQELGAWESFVPLHRAKDGFWANTIPLPVESQVEWKFILVEDGKISRWEECGNRYLVLTSQDEEVYLEKCWGCI